jgi:hypothetical protein
LSVLCVGCQPCLAPRPPSTTSPAACPSTTYILARSNRLEALVKRTHPPLVVCRVRGLFLAQAQLVLLVRNQQRLGDAAALAVERVAGALPALLAQICLGVHGGGGRGGRLAGAGAVADANAEGRGRGREGTFWWVCGRVGLAAGFCRGRLLVTTSLYHLGLYVGSSSIATTASIDPCSLTSDSRIAAEETTYTTDAIDLFPHGTRCRPISAPGTNNCPLRRSTTPMSPSPLNTSDTRDAVTLPKSQLACFAKDSSAS